MEVKPSASMVGVYYYPTETSATVIPFSELYFILYRIYNGKYPTRIQATAFKPYGTIRLYDTIPYMTVDRPLPNATNPASSFIIYPSTHDPLLLSSPPYPPAPKPPQIKSPSLNRSNSAATQANPTNGKPYGHSSSLAKPAPNGSTCATPKNRSTTRLNFHPLRDLLDAASATWYDVPIPTITTVCASITASAPSCKTSPTTSPMPQPSK